ncbi:MAG: DUF448 domain-containing protein [Magnetococcales bacterium]|nr:DUF448 domain-containing protein [Magnetococcales bacterium]
MRRIKSKNRGSNGKVADTHSINAPGRMCIVTRKTYPKSEMLRFVAGPDKVLVEDLTGKLPGRGSHVLPSRENIAKLLKRSGLKAEELEQRIDRIGKALLRRLLDGLNLARRAGDLSWGMRGITEYVEGLSCADERQQRAQPPMLWLLAADSASNTREKFNGQCRKLKAITQSEQEVFELLDRGHFGAVCGGNEVAVMVVYREGMVRRVRADIVRLQTFLAP